MDAPLATDLDLGELSKSLELRPGQVQAVIALLDDGNTVPFITRYRKDQTGGLDENQIRQVQAEVHRLRQLAERKQTILRSIESQGKLTPELAARIEAARTAKRLEDLYLPYRPQKQTLATAARERGLGPLADEVLSGAVSAEGLDARAADFVNPDRSLTSIADVLLGVGHILAEQFSERAELRSTLRNIYRQSGHLVSGRTEPEEKKEKAEVETSAAMAPAAAPVAETPAAVETNVETKTESAADESTGEESAREEAAGEEATSEESTGEEISLPEGAEGEASEPAAETAEAPAAPAPAAPAPARAPAATIRQKKPKPKPDGKQFRDYFEFRQAVDRIPPHRVLAINRGERAKVLRVRIEADTDALFREAEKLLVPAEHPLADFLRGCARDALSRLVIPSLERELRRELTDKAEQHAVHVFARNLRSLLLQPPVCDRRSLAIDPGFKNGCKMVALDQFGQMLGHAVVHLVGKAERRQAARVKLVEMVRTHQIQVIAIGNGTGCREAEQLVSEILATELKEESESGKLAYVIVNEAGASVYSTSQLGREEFPEYDATLRGAISIGRRLQDPLSELVKIDPANIGVGMYQHDVKARHLRSSLDDVVESCVNYVGVDVNTASTALLRYVSGLNQLTARRLYEYRKEHGPFRTREQLRDVPGFGEATFVQAAGFLKITGGANPLDATWIHPESYPVAERVLAQLAADNPPAPQPEAAAVSTEQAADAASPPAEAALTDTPPVPRPGPELAAQVAKLSMPTLAAELAVGELLLSDIVSQLTRPGRDPRESLPPPIFKHGVLKMEDLTEGMELTGTVLNVVDFGAFIDIGLHDSGLVHVSQVADRYIKDPNDVLSVGDVVRVWVTGIDKSRRRVSLTMIPPGTERKVGRHGKSSRPEAARAGGTATAATAASGAAPASGAPQRPRYPRRGRGAAQPAGAQSSGPPSTGRPPQGQPQRGGSRPSTPPRKSGPPKPLVPITKAMLQGKEPMRTFGDLLQFVSKKEEPAAAPAVPPSAATSAPPPAASEPASKEPPAAEAPSKEKAEATAQ
ncbi:MAG: RNA-binding transcriptional accessory protein [Planctomycetia bacterium]|nr:RNA-binding transcriptional accessory protein [Planctomycetia bacterium]